MKGQKHFLQLIKAVLQTEGQRMSCQMTSVQYLKDFFYSGHLERKQVNCKNCEFKFCPTETSLNRGGIKNAIKHTFEVFKSKSKILTPKIVDNNDKKSKNDKNHRKNSE